MDEASLLESARSGDGDSFRDLVAPHLPSLHLHCYRMLGSYHDAEDVMQDVLVRAWRFLDGYQQQAPLRHWLYRIATTTALKAIEARAKRPSTITEIDYLEPFPERALDALGVDSDPAAVAERRESVSLAFIAALQLLPATQRAVLVLRDVLAWQADEVADLLGTTVAAVNSALQRARVSLRAAAPEGARRSLDAEDQQVLTRFIDAWHRHDGAGLAAVLHEDVELRMPPVAMEFLGRDAVLEFFATVPADGAFDTIQLVATRANGQPAVAAFTPGEGGVWQPYGLMVFDVHGETIATIMGFPTVTAPGFHSTFADPPELADAAPMSSARFRDQSG